MITSFILFLDNIKLWGFELIDFSKFYELLIRFSLNLAVVLLLVRWLYYGSAKRKDYLFTFLLISTIVFLLCYLLANVKLKIGFALGLFAIFGILRYRTSQIPIKEMTYLFLVIGISVINALANKEVSIAEIIFTNIAVIGITYGFEKIWFLKHESAKTVIYERIDLIKPEKYNELVQDLQLRTGISKINRVEIGKIDFLKDACRLKIYYFEPDNSINLANSDNNLSGNDDDD
jgi:hypothetical protein